MKLKFKKPTLNHLWFILTIVVLVLDLVSKALTDGIYQAGIDGVFHIESVHNTGASFSLFADVPAMQIVFVILGILVSLFLLFYSFLDTKAKLNGWFFSGASLMIAGILGNVVDRVCLGYVRDFIAIDFINFAIFNVADTALTVGVCLLMVWLVFFAYREKKEEKGGTKDF